MYRCALCGGVFQQPDDWTEDDVELEYAINAGYLPDEHYQDREMVCDDCYKRVMAWINSPEGRAYEERHGVYR